MVKKSKPVEPTQQSKQTAKWQYLGETDPAQYIHSNKTHRSVSEAFRDADYAYAGWKPRSEWQDCKEFMSGMLIMSPMIAFCLYILYLVIVATN
jgi:hypothetical protein